VLTPNFLLGSKNQQAPKILTCYYHYVFVTPGYIAAILSGITRVPISRVCSLYYLITSCSLRNSLVLPWSLSFTRQFTPEMLSRPGSPRPRPDQDQTGRDRDQDQDQDKQGRDQDQGQDLKKVVLNGLETKTRSRDMYAMLLYKSSKS